MTFLHYMLLFHTHTKKRVDFPENGGNFHACNWILWSIRFSKNWILWSPFFWYWILWQFWFSDIKFFEMSENRPNFPLRQTPCSQMILILFKCMIFFFSSMNTLLFHRKLPKFTTNYWNMNFPNNWYFWMWDFHFQICCYFVKIW